MSESCREMLEFSVGVQLHQGSALSSYLFALVNGSSTPDIQDVVPLVYIACK